MVTTTGLSITGSYSVFSEDAILRGAGAALPSESGGEEGGKGGGVGSTKVYEEGPIIFRQLWLIALRDSAPG
jgi:hypothetical protein